MKILMNKDMSKPNLCMFLENLQSPVVSRTNSPKSTMMSHLKIPQTASTKSVKFLNTIEILNDNLLHNNKENRIKNFLTPRTKESSKICVILKFISFCQHIKIVI